jgi:hypothetical protein
MTENEKSDIAQKDTQSAMEVHSDGVISDRTLLRELQHVPRRTGRWKSITREIVEAASDEVAPQGEDATGKTLPPSSGDPPRTEHQQAA